MSFILWKRQFKKDIFRASFYSCLFSKAKSRLKDIFSFYRKDNIKKIKSFILEQYMALPLDGRDSYISRK